MPNVFDRTNTATNVSAERSTELLKRAGYTAALKLPAVAAAQGVAERTKRSKGGYSNHETKD